MKPETAIAIIPARYGSTRLPGKPLLQIDGKSLIELVYRRVEQARTVGRIIVATDDARIAQAVDGFGGEVAMTRAEHQSGTDRLAKAADTFDPETLIVNVQGDEPLIEPFAIDQAVIAARRGDADVATLMTRMTNPTNLENPNRVKVVCD